MPATGSGSKRDSAAGNRSLREFEFSNANFTQANALYRALTGMSMTERKSDLVYSRLVRRLRATDSSTFRSYLAKVAAEPAEAEQFVNALTTNLTSFFREGQHFPILAEHATRTERSSKLRVWCAASSTGEEPYSIAMSLAAAYGQTPAPADIVATDLDTAVLQTARAGIYDESRVATLSRTMLRQFFLRGKGAERGLVPDRAGASRQRLVPTAQPSRQGVAAGRPVRCDLPAQRTDFLRSGSAVKDADPHRRHPRRSWAALYRTFRELVLRVAPFPTDRTHRLLQSRFTIEEIDELNSYFDPYLQRHAMKILPGEYALGGPRDVIVTVLGSCVAACIRDERQGIGGMNHFMLPNAKRAQSTGFDDAIRDADPAARYGVNAMELLINGLIKRGSRRQDLTAKVFGGGAVLGTMVTIDIGRANGNFVRRFLQTEGVPLLAEDLFGELPRKVYFFPDTGEVRVKYLRTVKNDTVAQRERTYASTLRSTPDPNVEFFTWPNESAS